MPVSFANPILLVVALIAGGAAAALLVSAIAILLQWALYLVGLIVLAGAFLYFWRK